MQIENEILKEKLSELETQVNTLSWGWNYQNDNNNNSSSNNSSNRKR
jgi:hypothetical protein